MLNTVKERLGAYLEYKGVNKSEFGRRIGVSSAFVSSIRKSIQPDKIALIQKEFPDLDTLWLLTGEGEMLKSEDRKPEAHAELIGRPYRVSMPEEGVRSVRFFAVTPTATFQEFCAGDSEAPDFMSLIAPPGEQIDESSCVFEIHGESMQPTIPDRARVLCREIPPTRWHNISVGVVVIAYGDRFVIKRVVENGLGSSDYIILASDNPEYPGTETVARADIRCIFQARQVLSYPIR